MTETTVSQDFVVFLSPGSFVHEATTKAISSWDIEQAAEMAHEITERWYATPFAFYFITKSRGPDDLDSHVSARSPRYFLGGTVKTLTEIKAERNPENRILISNMEGNGWDRVIVNDNSWRVTQPLDDDDVVLDWKPRAKA